MRRLDACTMPVYMRDLSIHGFLCPGGRGSLEPMPCRYEGMTVYFKCYIVFYIWDFYIPCSTCFFCLKFNGYWITDIEETGGRIEVTSCGSCSKFSVDAPLVTLCTVWYPGVGHSSCTASAVEVSTPSCLHFFICTMDPECLPCKLIIDLNKRVYLKYLIMKTQ